MLKVDAGLATLLATAVTAAYFILGAAILFPLGMTPAGIGVVDQISSIFTESYGPWSKSIFLVSAMATLLSTLLAATAVNGRIITDFLCSLGLVDRGRPQAVAQVPAGGPDLPFWRRCSPSICWSRPGPP